LLLVYESKGMLDRFVACQAEDVSFMLPVSAAGASVEAYWAQQPGRQSHQKFHQLSANRHAAKGLRVPSPWSTMSLQ
jgi:hypothetical protein